jgi:hypothetical protein
MQLKRLLVIITLLGALLVSVSAIATAYKPIPAMVLSFLAIATAIVVLIVIRRVFSTQVSESTQLRRASLIWPLAVLVGSAIEIFDATQRGWKDGDIVGVVIAFLVLAGYYWFVYRKRGNDA